MITLSSIHYIFIIMTIFILIALLMKKEIVVPCIIGILLIGFAFTHNIISSIQILSTSLVASNIELFNIILVIALVTSMSKAMHSAGVDEFMIRPIRKVIKRPSGAFWGIGLCMLIVSWLIWPSPAVALIGALLLPVSSIVGLPAIWAAVSMNIFGHGIGLSSDFFIQGAPAITAKSANIDVTTMINSSLPLWIVMSLTVCSVTYFQMHRALKHSIHQPTSSHSGITQTNTPTLKKPVLTAFLSLLICLTFIGVIAAMLTLHIIGSDATSLVAGISLILTCIITFANSGIIKGLEDIVHYLKEGFVFSIKIFAPVIVIAAFFFIGSHDFALKVLGTNAPSILSDISLYISAHVPLSKGFVVLIEVFIGAITGLDGSGFSGLPLVGSIASTFASTTNINAGTLAALGQITTIWIGGGTIIPWAVIPVAAICNVSPTELARKNLVPVMIGLLVTSLFAITLL